MPRSLSPRSSLVLLRREAKRWLKALRAADPAAIARLRDAWPDAPTSPSLRDVQHALAREFGLQDWGALSAAVADLALDAQSLAERVAIILRHGWDGDRTLARRVLARHPDIATYSLFTAASCGDVPEVRRRLASEPETATQKGGPRAWTALAYVTYGRLDGTNAVTIAQLLLDAGADPAFTFDDGWGNPFTLLTGAIGLGEGVKPTHPQAHELVELLIAAGADPYDTQALYNTSIVDDDVSWTERLWQHCERQGTTARWSATEGASLGGKHKVGTLNYLLGNAVAQNHVARTAWLLAHGADANTVHAYTGRPVHTEARLSGFSAVAQLLEAHGARAEALSGALAFQAALMAGNAADVRAMATSQPALANSGAALLHVAQLGATDAVSLLLTLGAPVNAVDHEGISALHRAVQSGSLATVDALLAAGADIDLRERKWRDTPLRWAQVLGKPHVAARLVPLSRDVRALATGGHVARLEAVLGDDRAQAVHIRTRHDAPTPCFCLPDDDERAAEVVRVLLAHGADPSVTNPQGKTAGQVARLRGLDEAADLLSPEADTD